MGGPYERRRARRMSLYIPARNPDDGPARRRTTPAGVRTRPPGELSPRRLPARAGQCGGTGPHQILAELAGAGGLLVIGPEGSGKSHLAAIWGAAAAGGRPPRQRRPR